MNESMEFFMPMIPPTVTQQEHQVVVRNGKPVFYDPPELKEARQKLTAYLAKHKPEVPFVEAVRLTTKWIWPISENKTRQLKAWGVSDYAEYKITKPDTDNMIKLLKDCMTRCGFWKDDAQVASEITEKFLGLHPGIYIKVEVLEQWTP